MATRCNTSRNHRHRLSKEKIFWYIIALFIQAFIIYLTSLNLFLCSLFYPGLCVFCVLREFLAIIWEDFQQNHFLLGHLSTFTLIPPMKNQKSTFYIIFITVHIFSDTQSSSSSPSVLCWEVANVFHRYWSWGKFEL